MLKFLTVDFVWNRWLTTDQNSTIQQFNSLGNTQRIRSGLTNLTWKGQGYQEIFPTKNHFQSPIFLGLASYYRCFIKGFASIAGPLTGMLKGENRKVSNYQTRKIDNEMTKQQRDAYHKLSEILASEDVLLSYPFD